MHKFVRHSCFLIIVALLLASVMSGCAAKPLPNKCPKPILPPVPSSVLQVVPEENFTDRLEKILFPSSGKQM